MPGYHSLDTADNSCEEIQCSPFAFAVGTEGDEAAGDACAVGTQLSAIADPSCDVMCAMGYYGVPAQVECPLTASDGATATTVADCQPCQWPFQVVRVGATTVLPAPGAEEETAIGVLTLRLAAAVVAGYSLTVANDGSTAFAGLGTAGHAVTNTVGESMPGLQLSAAAVRAAFPDIVRVFFNAPVVTGQARAADFAVTVDNVSVGVASVQQSPAGADPGFVDLRLDQDVLASRPVRVRFVAQTGAQRPASAGGALADSGGDGVAAVNQVGVESAAAVVMSAVVRHDDPQSLTVSFSGVLQDVSSDAAALASYNVLVTGDGAWGRETCLYAELVQGTVGVCAESADLELGGDESGFRPTTGSWGDASLCRRRPVAQCESGMVGSADTDEPCSWFDFGAAAVGGMRIQSAVRASLPDHWLVWESALNSVRRIQVVSFVAHSDAALALRFECDVESSMAGQRGGGVGGAWAARGRLSAQHSDRRSLSRRVDSDLLHAPPRLASPRPASPRTIPRTPRPALAPPLPRPQPKGSATCTCCPAFASAPACR